MRKTLNRTTIQGRVYQHALAAKVTGETSKNPGTNYIGGSIDVATDDEGLNIVTVNFTYVTETTKAGGKNSTYAALMNIINNGKTILTDGMENATMVKIDTALGLNDFYTNRDGEEKLVSAKRNEGGFVTIVSHIEGERNKFECDMLINGTRLIEADPEKNIDADYLEVKGAVFSFRNSLLPVTFVVRNSSGIKYFESLEASASNPAFTKVWGNIESQTTVTRVEEESAFGEASVKEYTRTSKAWVVTGTARECYEMGDEQNGITADEIKKAIADREVYLADVKKRQDEYQASKATTTSVASTGVSAASGGFNF